MDSILENGSSMNKIEVLGVNVSLCSPDVVLSFIEEMINSSGRALITNVNVHALNLAYEQDWFRRFLNGADLVFCDGMGVRLGARLLGYDLPERFTPADWIWQLASLSAQKNFSIYLLGSQPGVAENAARSLKERFPELKIAGTHPGFFDKSPDGPENLAILDQINFSETHILLVGFGMPLQEKWLKENWSRLKVNIAIPCGALFEYLSGDLPRGPRWMTDNYLEWLARVIISPRRYGKRYSRDVPIFLYRILKQRLAHAPE
jgi:N-acetylglucosaminyldiphosphoundecaprenol N-acetyl-beta-D-mannosaminyltransferase